MSFLQAVRRNAAFRARDVAMLDSDGEAHSWASFQERVARVASGLTALGVASGDRVGILALNCRPYLEVKIAIWWIGATVVPMNTRWSTAENLYVIADACISFLFTDQSSYGEAAKLERSTEGLCIIGLDDAASANAPTIQQLFDNHRMAPVRDNDSDELGGIYYTGGTTGQPKGVMLSHNALWVNAVSIAMAQGMRGRDRILHAAPLFHLSAGALALAGMAAGASHVFLPKFVACDVIQAVQRFSVSKTILVPTMIQMVLEDPTYAPEKLATLDTFSFGAAPIPDSLLERLNADLPRVALLHNYGQTEMGPTISYLEAHWQYPGSPKKLSVGTPFIGVEAKVVDEFGKEVLRGARGEIWARGPGQMSGYLNKPKETSEAITPDGWIRTGDIAYQDDDGYLYICDRAKDMVISGGENVFSGEVESAILTHPAVRQAVMIGVPDVDYGERVHAVLVLHPGSFIDLESLRNHCRSLIAGYKCPRSFEVLDTLPLSAMGKVLKRQLRADHLNALAQATAA